MDFSLASFESRVGPTQSRPESGGPDDYHHQQQQQQQQRSVVGSGYAKQQRPELEEHEKRISKLAKTIDLSTANPNKPTLLMQFPQGSCSDNFVNPLPRSDNNNISVVFSSDNALNQHAQMLSFSSRKPVEANIAPSNLTLPYYPRMLPSLYSRYAGYGGGGRLNTSMHGDYSRIRGPFTPSQWIELEHQALIYKCLSSNVPVPSHLLLPLKNSLSSSSLSPLPHKSWWASLQLGYSDNTDPEPGRCRRTDGKKWRCSRDAVADQKYCERHINRGRPRSRKPVEGQTGHAATGTDAATTSSVEVPPPITSSVSTTMSSALPVGGSSNSLTTITTSTTDAPHVNRMQDLGGLSVMSSSSTVNLKSDEFTFDILNQEIITPEESSRSEFGHVSTDSLLNPSRESSYIDSKSYDASPFLDFIGQDTGDQYQLRHFIDVWPNDTSEHSAIAWPAELKSDWTKLSMSIPMTSSDFSSSSNSSKHRDNLVLSPLRLSREFEPTLMSLAGSDYLAQNEIKWVPTSWAAASDCSVGGPLGEALTNSSGYEKAYKNYPSSSSSLNLLTDGWDGSPQVGSSPTGVLQTSTFCSLSNSSSESSPRGEYKRNYIVGASIYDDVLGTPLASTSVPSL